VERFVNAGAGVEPGKPLFTISDTSVVWVIASVPEARVNAIRVGSAAEVRAAGLGDRTLSGRVPYVGPRLDETTRTARVRVEVVSPGEALKAGMFAEVGFQVGARGSDSPGLDELVVAVAAVQRVGERTVVFLPRNGEPGRFEVRDVEVGGEVDGYRPVLSGLALGEKVVANGSFDLKAALMKGDLEHDDHH
jgi:RND family efflux transporter MFP subunit